VQPGGIGVGDLNHDGKLDLAVSTYTDGGMVIFLGTGTGTFQISQVLYTSGYRPTGVALGDLDGDGNADLAGANSGDPPSPSPLYPSLNSVTVLLGGGDGTFQVGGNYGVGSKPISVAVTDFDRDGKQDLVTANSFSNDVTTLLGTGNGVFGARQ